MTSGEPCSPCSPGARRPCVLPVGELARFTARPPRLEPGQAAPSTEHWREQQQQQHGGGDDYNEEEDETTGLPSDVPRGHFAVYVGERRRRFVVSIALLDCPEFRSMPRRTEEEFGFTGAGAGAGGILVLPCEEVAFRSLTCACGAR